jgi:hypothetical protein
MRDGVERRKWITLIGGLADRVSIYRAPHLSIRLTLKMINQSTSFSHNPNNASLLLIGRIIFAIS